MKHMLLAFSCIFAFVNSEQWEFFTPRLGLPQGRTSDKRSAVPIWATIDQKLDHFDSTNNETWAMRLLINPQFFKPTGPMFIMLGGEQPINMNWLQGGNMFDMAEANGAYMLFTEHRFYGKSRPTSDFTTESFKYLTTEQALADVVHVIKTYKNDNSDLAASKVVVFGGSYSGNMAIWMRQLYPNVVHAAVSSSAPILAKSDFYEYNEVVQKMLGEKCSNVITNAIDQIRIFLGTPEGIQRVQKDFNMCNPVDVSNPLDVMYFFSIISSYFGSVVQYATGNLIESTCNALLLPTTIDDYTRLAKFLSHSLGPRCRKNYYNMTEYFSNPYILTTNKRQWLYQTCTQYGYFQTTTSKSRPYSNSLPIEMYHAWCQDFFGPSYNPTILEIGIARTNLIFGGLNPKVTRVVSVQGTGDPWGKLGLTENLNPSAPVIVINGTSHCEDMNVESNTDSAELKCARIAVQNYIRMWLQEN